MGDHFVFLVDRLLTESTLEAAIESQNRLRLAVPSTSKDNTTEFSSRWMDLDLSSSAGKSVQCRICHEEEDDMNMEMPCSCRGSLKYAHRKCVQRWCNEKGNTICEICHQQFEPGYTAPPPLFCYGTNPMNFRDNWEIPRRNLHNPPSIAMVTTDNEYFDSDFDEYPATSPRSVMCCRIIAIIFMVLLVFRHTLPIIIRGAGDYSMTLFTVRLGSLACSSDKRITRWFAQWCRKKSSTSVVYAVTDIENSWDSSAYICHGEGIYCYPMSGSPAGSSFSPY